MSASFPSILPLGDSAAQITLGDTINLTLNQRVQALVQHLRQSKPQPQGVIEVVPAYTSLIIHFDLLLADYPTIAAWAEKHLIALDEIILPAPRRVEIPVYYGGEYGPDLDFVAQHNHLKPSEVIAIHSAVEYPVYMMGFTPGFPYLGGLDARIAAPRLTSPRLRVPAGSVGIAGTQTGIYSLESPGGWQLIGWTPVRLFNSRAEQPALLRAGDVVIFKPC